MILSEDLRVYEVGHHGDLVLNRVERQADQERPGTTAISLNLVNHGEEPVTVERVEFSNEALSVLLPIDEVLASGGELVVVGPEMADKVTFKASIQGKSAQFKAGAVFRMTLHIRTQQGEVTFAQPISWGFWMEHGYGFTLFET